MLRLCTICARGGSVGVKNKNIRPILGLPLVAHSIVQARRAGIFDGTALSSDSGEILAVGKEYGVDYLVRRPDEMAGNRSPKVPAIRHCVSEAEKRRGERFDIIVDLDATSPLRTVDDIKAAVDLLEGSGAPNVITACPSRRSPYFNLIERDPDGRLRTAKQLDRPFTDRQSVPATYDMNASIYVWRRDVLMQEDELFLPDTQLYEMPEERSLDIDTPLDFEIVSFLMQRHKARYTYDQDPHKP